MCQDLSIFGTEDILGNLRQSSIKSRVPDDVETRAAPSRVKPGRSDPSRTEARRAEQEWAKLRRARPSRTEPFPDALTTNHYFCFVYRSCRQSKHVWAGCFGRTCSGDVLVSVESRRWQGWGVGVVPSPSGPGRARVGGSESNRQEQGQAEPSRVERCQLQTIRQSQNHPEINSSPP